jgi:hypothetical protein
MTQRCRWPAWTAIIITALIAGAPGGAAPAPVTPGESPLAVVPAQAPIVVHLRGVTRTKDRIATLVKNALPDIGILAAAQLDQALTNALEGRKLQGVDPAGPVFLTFLDMPKGDADQLAVALIARVTKYADFRDGLLTDDERKSLKPDNAGYERAEIMGREYFFVDRGAYAVLTPNKETATQLTKKQPGLDGKVSAEIGRKFLEADLAAYVNLAAVNKEFGDQIRGARQFMELAIEAMPAGGTDKQSVEMAKNVFGSVFQLIEDGRAFVVAFDFRPEGLALHLQAQVGAETKTNKFLKDQKPAVLDALGTLPGGMTSYTATAIGDAMLKALAPIMYGTSATDDGKKAMEAAIDELIASGQKLTLSAANVPPAGINIATFDDPAKAAQAQLKLFRALGEGATFQNAAIKGKPEIKENAESYKGFKFHYVRIVFDLDKLAEAVPGGGDDVKKAMKKLLGEDLKSWFGTDGGRYVSLIGKDWAAAKERLDIYLNGSPSLGSEPAYIATRKQLPAEATVLMLADAGKFAQAMTDYMLAIFKAIPGVPFNLPAELKPVATNTSYMGFAISFRAEHGGFEMFLPAKAVQEIRKVITPLLGGG